MLQSLTARAADLMGVPAGGFFLFRPERDMLEWIASHGSGNQPVGFLIQRGQGVAGRVIGRGMSRSLSMITRPGRGGSIFRKGNPGIAIPGRALFVGATISWVSLIVMAASPRQFVQADVDLLGLFSTQAAIAVRNSQLLAMEHQQAVLAEALGEAAARSGQALWIWTRSWIAFWTRSAVWWVEMRSTSC